MNPLIVALDLPTARDAFRIVEKIWPLVDIYKIGLSLQLDPDVNTLISSIQNSSGKIFLDYKYYDVPETMRKAVSQAADRDVSFLTIHGSGDAIKAAVDAAKGKTKILCVTTLTSMDQDDIRRMGYPCDVNELVLSRATEAYKNGADGCVCSGHEAESIRQMTHDDFLIVCPGIRPIAKKDDQKRTMTPIQAITAGANYIVVGRPITEAKDPEKVTQKILSDIVKA